MTPHILKLPGGFTTPGLFRAACALCLAVSFSVLAQNQPGEEARPNKQLILGVPQRAGAVQPESADESTIGLPYSQILRNTEPPYEKLFRDVHLGGRLEEKIGPGDLFMSTRLLNGPRFNAPLFSRGVRPENADFKLGRFYLDFRALSGGLIYSDNASLRETNRNAGVIGIVRLTMAAILQVTDNLRIRTYGTLVWLPFRGEIGIAGFGIKDPFAQFETVPSWQTQLTYDFEAGKWRIEAIDDFRVRDRQFGAVGSFNLYNGERFSEEDRAGRFVFGDRTRGGTGARSTDARFDESFFEARNLVGAVARRLLPTDARMEIGAHHSDLWYYNSGVFGLPHSRDSAFVALISERETLRFKPFVRYSVSRRDSENWDQEAHAGVRGPISENLQMLASAGYFADGGSSRKTYLARVRLRHTPGPFTFQQLEFHRGLTEPEEGIETSWYYLLRQVLGPDFFGELFAFRADFNGLRLRRDGTELRAGLRLTYNLGKNATVRTSATYTDFNYTSRNLSDYTAWIGQAELLYRLRRSLHLRLIYQHHTRDSTLAGDSFEENFVGINFIKYF